MDEKAIGGRIRELIQLSLNVTDSADRSELEAGALSLYALVYGSESSQHRQLADLLKRQAHFPTRDPGAVRGFLSNMLTEIDTGLVGDLQKRASGEVLTDFIQLARSALDQHGQNAKNVAAVLAAAAFEDTIRRMGASFAGVMGRDDLQTIINALKEKEVIQPPQLGIALSYLGFRNHALHANWDKIERESVASVVGFVEQMLLKHFS